MTIVVSVQCSEGIVLAADSASAISSTSLFGSFPRRVWSHAKKLSHISDFNIGALSWGLGAIDQRNIQSLMYEFETSASVALGTKEAYEANVLEVSTKLHSFFGEKYRAYAEKLARQNEHFNPEDDLSPMGMIVAGYSHGSFESEQYRFVIPDDPQPERIDFQEKKVGILFEGLPDAIHRLEHGIDPSIVHALSSIQFTPEQLEQLYDSLKEVGFVESHVSDFIQSISPKSERSDRYNSWVQLASYNLILPGMPLQDGIDLAVWLIEATIGRYRFGWPWPLAGGDIDIAVITHANFKWIHRKSWHSYTRKPAYFWEGE